MLNWLTSVKDFISPWIQESIVYYSLPMGYWKSCHLFQLCQVFPNFSFFFFPCQWTSFHLITMLDPVIDVLFNKIKKPTAYSSLTPWSFLASEYLCEIIFCSCFVVSLPSCFCMLHWSTASLKMPTQLCISGIIFPEKYEWFECLPKPVKITLLFKL